MVNGTPKVSVSMVTYNHERYIAQAIEGVVMQRTGFSVELVIGEDCSTDGTRAIVDDYQRRYPERIRLVVSEANVGYPQNYERTLNACRGQYIAMLDGDDFWTDPQKLQFQADFLDSRADCAMCFHNAMVLNPSGQLSPSLVNPMVMRPTTTLRDILGRNFIPTCSVMFRNRLFEYFPAWVSPLHMSDWPLHILNAMHGDIGYIDRIMGTYRQHDGGIWTSSPGDQSVRSMIEMYGHLQGVLGPRWRSTLRACIYKQYFEIARYYQRQGESGKATRYFVKCLLGHPLNRYVPVRHMLGLARRLYAPSWLQRGASAA